MKIIHKLSGATLFEGDYASIKAIVQAAVIADADLAGAYLAGADLADAYLAGAYLAGADFTDADLAGAYLAGAYLAGADLAGADLAGANLARAYLTDAYLARAYLAGADLAGANLARAYLAGADLAGADLADAYLAGAYLAGANLTDADLAGANLTDAAPPTEAYEHKPSKERYLERASRYREKHPEVPVVESLDAKILRMLETGGKLDMSTWHTCETTHCRAGWAITLAGVDGLALEHKYGSQRAGTMIYRASTGRVPHFFASNERALEDIKDQAAIQGKS